MNLETTDEIIVYAKNMKSGKMCKAFFVNLSLLYVTYKRYLEERSRSEQSRVVVS